MQAPHASTGDRSKQLDRRAIRFFARHAYRFLLLLIAGDFIMLAGAIGAFREPIVNMRDRAADCILIGIFAVYAAATIWYAYRMAQGTWKDVWLNLTKRIEAADLIRARTAQPLPSPISGVAAALSFLVTGLAALLWALFFVYLHHVSTHWDGCYPFVLFSPILFGSGTLMAAVYDRSWWKPHKRVWIGGFNFLTMVISLLIAAAMLVFSPQ